MAEILTIEEVNSELSKKLDDVDKTSNLSKVDLESLGLDNLDKKPQTKEVVADPIAIKEEKKEENSEIKEEKKELPQEESKDVGVIDKLKDIIEQKKAAAEKERMEKEAQDLAKLKEQAKKMTAEIQEKKKAKTKAEQAAKVEALKQDKIQKYVNSKKKKALKQRLEKERLAKLNEKKRQEKLKKLQDLREKYIQDGSTIFDEDAEIIPQRKESNPFISEELPAQPILDRYRVKENLHIPIIITPEERVVMLFAAVAGGNVEYFNSSYKYVQNPNVRNSQGDTLLTYAIIMQKYSIIAAILEKGANPNLANALGYTPIDIAIELIDLKTLELLANNNADLNYVDGFKRTYLMHASRVGFLPAVELFVMRGVDINAIDKDGFTALSIAYRHKKEIIVKFLLKNGAQTWVEKPFDPEKKTLIQELETRWQ